MFSSSPRSASPPPTIPFKFRRKSSSASTSVPFDKYAYSQERDTASPLSPLPSSSPLLTPLHAGRRQEYEGGKYGAYDYANDGLCDPLCDFEAVRDPWSHYTRRGNASPFPVHHPLPSLITKFGSCAPRDEVPLFFPESPPSPHNPRMTSHLYSAEDSAIIDDDHEEYDLESMDIHVRETYFATSAERGRWMSSPIAPRKRTQAAAFVSSPIRPMRGHSTPVKNVGTNGLRNAFELQERARRQSTNSIADTDFLSSSFFDENDDEREHSRYSSPLPPSSPLTSPMSIGPSLSDDWHFEDGMAVDESTSHPDPDKRFPSTTPDLSVSSSTDLRSRDESAYTPPPPGPAVSPPASSTLLSACLLASSHEATSSVTVTRHRPVLVPLTPDSTIGFKSDGMCPPLSPLDFDEYPSAELRKVPRTNAMKPLHLVQPPASATTGAVVTHSVASSSKGGVSTTVSLSVSIGKVEEGVHLKQATASGPGPVKKTAKKPNLGRDFAKDDPEVLHPQTAKKSSTPRSKPLRLEEKVEVEEPKPKTKMKRQESCACDLPEPPKKKSKLSGGESDESESSKGRCPSRKRAGPRKARPLSRSPSLSKDDTLEEEDLTSQLARICDTTTPPLPPPRPKSRPKATPSASLDPSDPADGESHVALTGMLIEALATSRATSMDSAALYLALTQTHPNLKSERPKKELLKLITTVLEAGRTRCGMFEKVDSSGEASRHKALEGRWFYVPERDEDQERALLISAIMPRQKRNETKKYKQYYYRPLDKISRWDPEDAP